MAEKDVALEDAEDVGVLPSTGLARDVPTRGGVSRTTTMPTGGGLEAATVESSPACGVRLVMVVSRNAFLETMEGLVGSKDREVGLR